MAQVVYNTDKIVEGVLTRINRLGPGQDISQVDKDKITNWLPAIYADLREREIYAVGEPEDLQPEAFIWLVDVVAGTRGAALGVVVIDGKALSAIRENAETMLQQVGRLRSDGTGLQLDPALWRRRVVLF